MTRRTAVLLTCSLALLAPASAEAAKECAKTATVTSGADDVLRYTAPDATEPLSGKTIKRRSGFYRAEGTVKLRYVGNVYTIRPGAIFKIVCYGKSRQAGAVLPALDLLVGDAKVKTSKKKPGGFLTSEGLIDPRRDPTMTISVSRELNSGDAPDAEEMFAWFAGYISAPLGTTRTATTDKADIGVTPYVGSKPGVCIYVRKVRLVSKGRKNGHFTGTVTELG